MHSTLYVISACGFAFFASLILAMTGTAFMLAHISNATPDSYEGIRQSTAGSLLSLCVAFATPAFVFAGLMS